MAAKEAKDPKRVAAGKKAWRTKVRKYGKAKAIRMSFGKRSRSAPRAPTRNPGNPGRSPTRGWGKWVRAARSADVLSGPGQGSVMGLGFTKAAGEDAMNRYFVKDWLMTGSQTGQANVDTLKATYGGIGTGLARDWARSQLGVYRGVGKNKLLSHVMAANPEILASSAFNPVTDFKGWNRRRGAHDRGYDPAFHVWTIDPADNAGKNFWGSVAFDGILKGFQIVAQKVINPRLPKGFNL